MVVGHGGGHVGNGVVLHHAHCTVCVREKGVCWGCGLLCMIGWCKD